VARLSAENEALRAEASGHEALSRDKVALADKQAKTVRAQAARLELLERSVAQMAREFEAERTKLAGRCGVELEASREELGRLRRELEARGREMAKVKKLAKNILEQRTDVERFFLDSLDFVKQQVLTNRAEYRKEASTVYNRRMLDAHTGNGEYPRVRTFTKKFDAFSTNNVYKDLEQAEKWQVFSFLPFPLIWL